MKIFCFILLLFASYGLPLIAGDQPLSPNWGPNVSVYTSGTPIPSIQADADAVFNGSMTIPAHGGQPDVGQFVNVGHAFLFAPGSYTGLNINVGYYTSVIGLGLLPGSTTINSVNSPQGNNDPCIGGLNSFWRSAENFSTTPAEFWINTTTVGMTWAVSQAAPLRRLVINGTLYLFQLNLPNRQDGFTSGGFMADCAITAVLPGNFAVVSGTQQQWLSRNCSFSGSPTAGGDAWSNGVWNQMFVGCTNAPADHCGNCAGTTLANPGSGCQCTNCYMCPLDPTICQPSCTGNAYTTILATPIIAEKPFITSNPAATVFTLMIPGTQINKSGTADAPMTPVDFSNVYVALPTTPNLVSIINQRILAGYHIIFTPGIYNLNAPISVTTANTVVLGIGFPILISANGTPCIVVGDVNGVRIGGLLFQAGPTTADTLLQWGTQNKGAPSTTALNVQDGFIYDCFARVGRFDTTSTAQCSTNLMIQINSSNIVIDNTWLWRADHDVYGLVRNGDNPCLTGAQINGKNIIAYGLACEHTLNDLSVWNGDGGQCYFFQSEFPYDVTSAYASAGWTGYRVNAKVTAHKAVGIGIYSFFRDYEVFIPSAIIAPGTENVTFTNSFTRFLAGNGGIDSVFNGLGFNPQNGSPAVNAKAPGPAYLCNWNFLSMPSEGAAFRPKSSRR